MHEDTQGHFFRMECISREGFWGAPHPTHRSINALDLNLSDKRAGLWNSSFSLSSKKYCRCQHTEDHRTSRHRDSTEGQWADSQEDWACARQEKCAGLMETHGLSTWLSTLHRTPGIHTWVGNRVPTFLKLTQWGKYMSGSNTGDVEMSDESRERPATLTEGPALEVDTACVPGLSMIC